MKKYTPACIFILLFLIGPISGKVLDIHSIYQQVLFYSSNFDVQPPVLKTGNDYRSIAYHKWSDLSGAPDTIVIHEDAVRICENMSPRPEAALAFILAHELQHHFQRHIWSTREEQIFNHLGEDKELVSAEKQADLYAAFILHLMGYDALNTVPALLQKLYEGFGLLDNEPSEFPLRERLQIASTVCENASRLVKIFEMSNYLLAIGNLDDAIMGYLTILRQQVRIGEVINNLGVASLIGVLQLDQASSASGKRAFFYPTIIKEEADFRAPAYFIRTELLSLAEKYLKEAFAFFPENHQVAINLASLSLLKEDFPEFNSFLEQIRGPKTEDDLAAIQILYGIRDYLKGEKESQVRLAFQKVITSFPFSTYTSIARKNLQILGSPTASSLVPPDLGSKFSQTDRAQLLKMTCSEGELLGLINNSRLDRRQITFTTQQGASVFLLNAPRYCTRISIREPSTRQHFRDFLASPPAGERGLYEGFQSFPTFGGRLLVDAKNRQFFILDNQGWVLKTGVYVD